MKDCAKLLSVIRSRPEVKGFNADMLDADDAECDMRSVGVGWCDRQWWPLGDEKQKNFYLKYPPSLRTTYYHLFSGNPKKLVGDLSMFLGFDETCPASQYGQAHIGRSLLELVCLHAQKEGEERFDVYLNDNPIGFIRALIEKYDSIQDEKLLELSVYDNSKSKVAHVVENYREPVSVDVYVNGRCESLQLPSIHGDKFSNICMALVDIITTPWSKKWRLYNPVADRVIPTDWPQFDETTQSLLFAMAFLIRGKYHSSLNEKSE